MIAPPRPRASGGAPVQVLFGEARRRRRLIRLAVLVVVLAVALLVTGVAAILSPGPSGTRGSAPGGGGATGGGTTLPMVAWVDYDNRLHLGNLSSLTQRVVAEVGAAPVTPLVAAGGRVYFVDTAGTFVPSLGHWSEVVQALDFATGRISYVAPGQWIIPSADGRELYMSQMDNTSLIELPASGKGVPRRLVLPAGWYLPGGSGVAVGDGIAVQSTDDATTGRPTELAVWSPATGNVRLIGRISAGYGRGILDFGIVGAYTRPGGRYGLLAWVPAGCGTPSPCPIELTDTATLATKTVRSPLRFGFAQGGAFAPNGRELAVFVNRDPGAGGGSAALAIVSTGTGGVRLVPKALFRLGEDVAFARWLPGGEQLIAGNITNTYIVNSRTLASKPFSFANGQEVDFSVTVVSR